MSTVTESGPMRTTRPATTSPRFGCLRLCSKSEAKSSSPPVAKPGFSFTSDIGQVPPGGGILAAYSATESAYSRLLADSRANLAKRRQACACETLHLVDHRLERELGRIEHHRVRRGTQRRRRTPAVAAIARGEIARQDRL